MKTIAFLVASALFTSAASAVTIIGTVTGVDHTHTGTAAAGYENVQVGATITFNFDLPDPAPVLGSQEDKVFYGVINQGVAPLSIAVVGATTTYSGSAFAFTIGGPNIGPVATSSKVILSLQGWQPSQPDSTPWSMSFTDPTGTALDGRGNASLITYMEQIAQAGLLPYGFLELHDHFDQDRTLLTFVIPEPGTAFLAALSVATVGVRRHRR